ncbi:hypothetical protein RND81_01G104400 [Saponaria officinalis]|uniref:Peptidase A2 domain-containing protein n=1 Tax=Saponaria officinalis TaxID=3572 RepID=A0AAW1NDB9_SAPOF
MKNLSLKTLDDSISQENHDSSGKDEINKLDTKWSQKPNQRFFYYSRPSPMDVLYEEQEFQMNNNYNGKCIYKWNIDGQTDNQIYNQVHRMLMYSTICKQNKNTDSVIARMITSGFTGQLKGWWDNYLSEASKEGIYNSKTNENPPIENAVYILTVNIIEHFTGRFLSKSENVRTLLQNLRCKTLTDYRWYKDAFLCRVMELPESSSAHWKAKFIDGLPHLFAERVKTVLRDQSGSIPYNEYSYGRLIGACTEQGLKLCNEIKLNQQIKRQNLAERNQLGDFCEQFDCWTKKAISTLEIDDNIKDKIYKLLLTSDREGTYSSSSDSYENEIKNMDNDTYYSDSSKHRINVLDNNSWVELLKVVKDPEIRSKIIDQIGDETSSSKNRVIIPDNETYSMTKVHSLLKARKSNSHPSSLKDILLEIENLKSEIKQLKNEAKSRDVRIANLEMLNYSSPNPEIESIDNINETHNKSDSMNKIGQGNSSTNHFLQAMDSFISQKWLVNITLKIDNFFTKNFTALIDSGADQNVIQEGLIPTQYFVKTSHGLSQAGGDKLQIEFKLPEAFICVDNKCIPTAFLLVKDSLTKEILAIVKCVLKFQDDLYNQHFTIKSDCKAAKFMFLKDFKHDVSKQMFARWQTHLAPFDFKIVYKKGRPNPSYRGGSSSRGRGRGNYITNNSNPIVQHGSKKLIAANISGTSNTELEEFYEWRDIHKKKENSEESLYANVVKKNHSIEADSFQMMKKEYLKPHSYTMEVYKTPHYYEEILANNGCTFTHFSGANKEIYNFSKIIIGSIILIGDWGISPFTEKTITLRGSLIKYNYWDYIQAFDKVFLYENDKRSHTWFIKFNSDGMISYVIDPEEIRFSYHMRFFIEFSIPYIWRSCPITGYTSMLTNKFYCLKRKTFSKFWDTMIKKDSDGQLNCQPTLNLIKEKIQTLTQLKLKQIEDNKSRAKEKGRFLEFLDDDDEIDLDISESSDKDIIKPYMDALKKTLKARKEESDYVNKLSNSMDKGSDGQDPDDDSQIEKVKAFLDID